MCFKTHPLFPWRVALDQISMLTIMKCFCVVSIDFVIHALGFQRPLCLTCFQTSTGLPDFCERMKRPQKHDPELKNEEPPDFYRVSKLSPLPEPEYGRKAQPEFRGSSSMSSVAAKPRDTDSDSVHADNAESGHNGSPSLDSWDRKHPRGKGKVAINLCDVYEKEISPTGPSATESLTEADLQYLIHQNRALLRQASMKQQSGSKYDDMHG